METQDIRATLERLKQQNGASYAALSRMLGRNAAYLQQFVKRGTPARLDERDRALLASFFGVDEALLGGPLSSNSSMVQVKRLDVAASAGPGSVIEREVQLGAYSFDSAWLRGVSRARPEDLSIIRVAGDSMAPTLIEGDDVLVDQSIGGRAIRDGVYVLRRDETLMVKRLAVAPNAATLTISSDNAAYPTWSDCPFDSIAVVGRVVWTGRKLG